jgi:long-chain fatty acid transport protein
MKQRSISWVSCLILVIAVVAGTGFFAGDADATNGDNLISIGPISRAMGGVGIAAPQDAISAVFSNPAAMCFGPYCPGSEFNFAGTLFMPKAKARIQLGPYDSGKQSSDSDLFAIPAIGISSPISQTLRFGLAAYGVSGLGVDYRDKITMPIGSGETLYTNLQIMKFAPSLSYLVTPNLSIGGALHIDYGALDLGSGNSAGFAFGAELGAIYKTGPLSFGLVYISPQEIDHENVANFDKYTTGSTTFDNLKLESPQTFGFGVAYEPILNTLFLEANVKWLNWADAEGYKTFGWDDQWVFNIGAQYKPIPKLALRAGYNYGENPVSTHSWDDRNGPVNVQGKSVPRTQYEILRIAGFPAIVQSHITAGMGYQLTKSVSIDFAYMHAFEETIKETGTVCFDATCSVSGPGSVEASLYEDSVEFGITWRF